MAIGEHLLEVEQLVPLPRPEVFSFFAEAENLERITPPSLRFAISTPLPVRIGEGALIEYRLRLFGVPFGWQTRITHWKPGVCFVDEQLRGPYKKWVHTHSFSDAEGGTLVRDSVSYRLPLFPLGEVVHPLVRHQLEWIFRYRRAQIEKILVAG